MLFRISSHDLPRIQMKLQTVVAKINIRTKTSTKRIAELILRDSQTVPPTVPRDTGDLESTGRVEGTPQGHAVVYGGKAGSSGKFVDYAEFVHDDLRDRKYKRPGSGPKFVETHVLRRFDEMKTVMSADLQQFLNEEF